MERDKLVVLVCRGCCCGNRAKHPDVDHDAQLEAIRRAVAATERAEMRVTGCLGQCSSSNVVVVRGRAHTSDRAALWVGQVLSGGDTNALCAWLVRGGPLPDRLALRAFRRHVPAEGRDLAAT